MEAFFAFVSACLMMRGVAMLFHGTAYPLTWFAISVMALLTCVSLAMVMIGGTR